MFRDTIARPEHFIVAMSLDYGPLNPVDFSWLRPRPNDPITTEQKVRLTKELSARVHRCQHHFEIAFSQDLCRDMNDDVTPLLIRNWTRCPRRIPDDSLLFLGFATEALLDGCPMLGPMLEHHLADIIFTTPSSKGASAYSEERGIRLNWLHPCSQDRREIMNFWDRVKKR